MSSRYHPAGSSAAASANAASSAAASTTAMPARAAAAVDAAIADHRRTPSSASSSSSRSQHQQSRPGSSTHQLPSPASKWATGSAASPASTALPSVSSSPPRQQQQQQQRRQKSSHSSSHIHAPADSSTRFALDLAPNDPLSLALSYALSQKPLDGSDVNNHAGTMGGALGAKGATPQPHAVVSANATSLRAGAERNKLVAAMEAQLAHAEQQIQEEAAAAEASAAAGGVHALANAAVAARHKKTPSSRFQEAVLLTPVVDKRSFITKVSHLNPNARIEATSVGKNRSKLDRETVLGEDEEDVFWRELFISQTKEGSLYAERQKASAVIVQPAALVENKLPDQLDVIIESAPGTARGSSSSRRKSLPRNTDSGDKKSNRKTLTPGELKRELAKRSASPAPSSTTLSGRKLPASSRRKSLSPSSALAAEHDSPPTSPSHKSFGFGKRTSTTLGEHGFVRRSESVDSEAPSEGRITMHSLLAMDSAQASQVVADGEQKENDSASKRRSSWGGKKLNASLSSPALLNRTASIDARRSLLSPSGSGRGNAASPARTRDPNALVAHNEPPPTLNDNRALEVALKKLDASYAAASLEGDGHEGAQFLKPTYTPSQIHPTWLRNREDFKHYFGSDKEKHGAQAKSPQAQQRAGKHGPLSPLGAALAASHNAHASASALDATLARSASASALASSSSPNASGQTSSALAQSVSHPSPERALDLLALHAAEKPPHLRTSADRANIAALLGTIEYFARLPSFVRMGLAELAQLQRANKDEVLFTRIHGTRFMFVYSGAVVASSSIEGEEFMRIAQQTDQIRTTILGERAKKAREAEMEAQRIKEEEEREIAHLRSLRNAKELAKEAELARVAAAQAAIKERFNRQSKALAKEKQSEGTRAYTWSVATPKAAEDAAAASGIPMAFAAATPKSADAGTPTAAPSPTAAAPAAGSPVAPSPAPSPVAGKTPKRSGNSVTFSAEPVLLAPPSGPKQPRDATPVPAAAPSAQSPPPAKSSKSPSKPSPADSAAALDAAHGIPVVRGFEIGFGNASIWSPNMKRTQVAAALASHSAKDTSKDPAATMVTATLLDRFAPVANKAKSKAPGLTVAIHAASATAHAHSPASFPLPYSPGHYPSPADHVAENGMVFHRILRSGSLFGQNEMFENSYAGIERVLKLKAYQMRLSKVLSNSTKSSQSSGWLKLKTLVHLMITARDKAPLDSVVACSPCILFTWSHKSLEALMVATKERNLNNIMSSLNHFREILFQGWSYKQLLNLSSVVELKEFKPKTVLYSQGVIDKPVWDEKTHLLRSAKDVFAEKCDRAAAAEQARQERLHGAAASQLRDHSGASSQHVANYINNFGHNPANHNLYILTAGMLQLEKRCALQSFQRWPASVSTWELKSTLHTKHFFAGFIRGRELVGGESILGMEERDFTVSVPAGQTATCIVIKRAQFDQLSHKRIHYQIHQAVVRLRELAHETISSRITLRNHNLNHGVLAALKNAKAHSTKKMGVQSVNEYLMHLLRGAQTKGGETLTASAQAALITHLADKEKEASEREANALSRDAMHSNNVGSGGAAGTPSALSRMSSTILGGTGQTTMLSSSMNAIGSPKHSAAFAQTIDSQVKPLLEELGAGVAGANGLVAAAALAGGHFPAIFGTPQIAPAFSKIEQLIRQNYATEEESKRLRALQAKNKGVDEETYALLDGTALGSSDEKESIPAGVLASIADDEQSGPTSDVVRLSVHVEEAPSRPISTVPMAERNDQRDSEEHFLERSLHAELEAAASSNDDGSSPAATAAVAAASTLDTSASSAGFLTPQKVVGTRSKVAPTAPATAPQPSTLLEALSAASTLPVPGSAVRALPVASNTLTKRHAHHRSISSYIQSLPIKKGMQAVVLAATAAAAATASPSLQPQTQSPHQIPAIEIEAVEQLSPPENNPAESTSVPAAARSRLGSSKSASSLRPTSSPSTLAPLTAPRPSSSQLLSPSSPSPVVRHSPSTGALLPSILSHTLPALSPSPVRSAESGQSDVIAQRAFRSFHRMDHAQREAASVAEDRAAAKIAAALAAEAAAQAGAAQAKALFQKQIQAKLSLYESRLRHQQSHREAVYAAKINEISRKLQASIASSFYDNPFEAALSGDPAALEVSRNQAKIKQLLQNKAAAALEATSTLSLSARLAQAAANAPPTPSSGGPHPLQHLTAADLESIGIPLPPAPLAVDDLSLVSKAIWDRHIRYLTDLEADQRLVYAEYCERKAALEAVQSEHEAIRIALLNKRYLTGQNLSRDVSVAQEDMRKELLAKQAKADEEWIIQQQFNALHAEMLAMGAAGDEEGFFRDRTLDADKQAEDRIKALNQNRQENASYASKLLEKSAASSIRNGVGGLAGPSAALDAVSAMAASVALRAVGAARPESGALYPVSINPALQMEMETADEPPITDVMTIQSNKVRKETHSNSQTTTHTHNDSSAQHNTTLSASSSPPFSSSSLVCLSVVYTSSDQLCGGVVALYFPPLPPPPDLRKHTLGISQPASPRTAAAAAAAAVGGGAAGRDNSPPLSPLAPKFEALSIEEEGDIIGEAEE